MPAQSREIKNIWTPQEITALLWTPSRGENKKSQPIIIVSSKEKIQTYVCMHIALPMHICSSIHKHLQCPYKGAKLKTSDCHNEKGSIWQDCTVDHVPSDESSATKLPLIYLNKSNCRIYPKPQITTSHGFRELLGRHWKCIPLVCHDHRMTEKWLD